MLNKKDNLIIFVLCLIVISLGVLVVVKNPADVKIAKNTNISINKNVNINQNINQAINKSISQNQNINTNQLVATTTDKINTSNNKITTYFNKDIKILFDYPMDWGFVSVKNELTLDNKQIRHRHLFFSNFMEIFLSATNPNTDGPHRGGYWGDEGINIKNFEDLKNYCMYKEKCMLFKNSNNILIAKHQTSIGTEGGIEDDNAILYFMFNPNANLPSIVLSYTRLQNKNIDNLEKKFEKLIQSFKFIDIE